MTVVYRGFTEEELNALHRFLVGRDCTLDDLYSSYIFLNYADNELMSIKKAIENLLRSFGR